MKEKIYIVEEESNVDGEVYYKPTPCKTLTAAKAAMEKIIDFINTDSHFKGFKKDPQDFVFEQNEMDFSIIDPCDDYWEEICITEREIIE